MSTMTWHNYGYGICTSNLEVDSVERIEKLLDKAPDYKEKIHAHLKAKGISEPTLDDYYDATDESEYEIADLLMEVLWEVTGLNFVSCDDSEDNYYLIYMPMYPWNMDEANKSITEEEVANLIKEYVAIVSDTPIELDYQSVENYG